MNPTHLRLRNVRRFDNLDIDLPQGTVALTGGNGAGKSSLLNAIDIALFAERGELTDLITTEEDRLEIELTFEHSGELYRVRRQQKRGKSPTVDLERLQLEDDPTVVVDGGGEHLEHLGAFVPLTRENANATQALINETLGLTRKTFRASSFLKQGDTAAFTEADPAARKALLAEILRLSLWDNSDGRKPATELSLLGLARADLRDAEQKLPSLTARIDALADQVNGRALAEQALAEHRATLQTASEALAVAGTRLQEAQDARAANQAAAERLRACQAELDAATADCGRAEAELAHAAAAEASRATLQQQLDTAAALAGQIPDLEEQLERHRARAIKTAERDTLLAEARQRADARGRLVDESLRLHDQAHELRDRAVKVLGANEGAEHCDRCGQILGADAAQRAADSYADDADACDARGRALDEQAETELATIAGLQEAADAVEIPDAAGNPEVIRNGLTAARAAGERRAQVAEQLRHAAETAARKPALERRLHDARNVATKALLAAELAREGVADPDQLDADERNARAQANAAQAREQDARIAVARTEQILEQLAAAALDHDQLTAEKTTLAQLAARLRVAVTAYGRNGIPALIVEAVAVPQIEQEANRLLELMPTVDGTTLQVQLRTQRELKGGEGELRDALDIVIFDGDAERLYDSYSGGEQGRVNLCLRIALARLLAHRRGADSRLLAIDELPFLDALAQDQLVDVVKAVAADFDRVIVVGHSETFQQSFDQTIRIVKRGGRSVVDGAREQVAA